MKYIKKIKPIYIILGLFIIVLIVSALGSKTKEGMMSSGDYTSLQTYKRQQYGIISDIIKFANAQSTAWGSSDTFKANLSNYIKHYNVLSVRNFYKNLDTNKDGAVVVSIRNQTFIRDNTTNTLGDGEKLYYYDLNSMDKNQDGSIVGYKNTNQGNFYRDNSGNANDASSFTGTPYIMQSITDNDRVSQSLVDTDRALLDQQINMLTSTSDKAIIKKSLDDLLTVTNNIVALIYKKDAEGNDRDLYTYNPNNTNIVYHSSYDVDDYDAGIWAGDDYFDRDMYIDSDKNRDYYHKNYKQRRRDKRRRRSSLRKKETPKNSRAGYWKNMYLNTLNSVSNQQTPLYGSLLNGGTPGYNSVPPSVTNNYLINPAYNKTGLLSQNSSPGDTGDASSGVGMGYGASASRGASASKPVQSVDDMFLLNSQKDKNSDAPVGGCSAGNSSTNNCRPAPVPPCPPCERCPEPAFDCKRVPKYNSATNNQYLPQPVLADFSQFGM